MSGLRIPKDKIPLNSITHSVRSAQAILQYGVGAMVDFPDQTLMTAAPEYWGDRIIHIHDERLEKMLNVDYFGVPGGKDEYPSGIAYVRFPQWYFCPKCRKFQPLEKWFEEYNRKATLRQKEYDPYMKKPRCFECKKDLVPTRIVVACENGHIDDFPWVKWVHDKNTSGSKQICLNPDLTFETGATTSAGLEGLIIRCKTCKAKATLFGAFDKDAFKRLGNTYKCNGFMPWNNKKMLCDNFPRAIQRGASSLYFPKVISSLVIPPYSDKVNILIEQSDGYRDCLIYINECDEDEKEIKIKEKLDKWAENIGRQIAVDSETVKYILKRRLFDRKQQIQSIDEINKSQQYRVEEYEALTGKISKQNINGNDFLLEKMNIKDYDIPGLTNIMLVHKVREVRALIGFTRLNPPNAFGFEENTTGLVSVKESETRWYPGYEVRGEGIFLEFDNSIIDDWIRKTPEVVTRIELLNVNYSMSYQGNFSPRNITPKFILLHTIAHLIIRQLSFECGYTAASLRERIYCENDENGYIMSGIFIYTASGDSEGTLGGLVRQGYPDCMSRILKKAINTGELCSNDPVCISSEGQGREALNLAACHACVLLPETSCEEFNVLLDRGVVVGTFENKNFGFFSSWLNN